MSNRTTTTITFTAVRSPRTICYIKITPFCAFASDRYPTHKPRRSCPMALQRVSPDYGPISGGEKIFLVGYGFSEGQDLLVRFGDGTEPVSTKLFNPNILECILPPSHSTRRVVVTLHWGGGPEIQSEGEVLFTYEDVDNEMSVFYNSHWLCSCVILTFSLPACLLLTECSIFGDESPHASNIIHRSTHAQSAP